MFNWLKNLFKKKKTQLEKDLETLELDLQTMVRDVHSLVIHHSASNLRAHDNISVIRDWHRSKGWHDVGYHFFITKKESKIQRGRELDRVPAAQYLHNVGTLALCLSGDANFTNDQLYVLKQVCKTVTKVLPHVKIQGHKDFNPTECPGFNYKKVLGLNDEGYFA